MTDSSKAPSMATWTSFLKSIATFTGDLSTLTAPSFILSGTSILEYSSYWGEHPELFNAIAKSKDAESRMVAVVKWYTSTLKGSFSARHQSTGGEKKPLNPVLGETFHGSWSTKDGETTLIAEQVSHHPPVSAYRISSPLGIVLQGHNGQKSGFSGRTITVRQVGQAVLTLATTKPAGIKETETYLITLPQLTLEGLWYGSPYAELADKSYIISSSGWLALNEYSGKGWLTGEKNTIKTSIYPPGELFTEIANAKYCIEGQWINRLFIRSHDRESIFLDTHEEERVPITHQDTTEIYESRRLWKGVATALANHDYESASRLKSEIEQAQRDLRKLEKREDRTWQRKYFEWKEDVGSVVQKLMHTIGHAGTGGYWSYKGITKAS